MREHRSMHADKAPVMGRHHYKMLAINLILSLLIMYLGMFAMIWSGAEFVQNLNFFYMALVMWAPMSAVMMLTMRSMYGHRALNIALYALFAGVFVLSLIAIRAQGLVGDRQFLRSMIPHHSGAILMCQRASIRDPEIKALCSNIITSQLQEIDQMKTILGRRR